MQNFLGDKCIYMHGCSSPCVLSSSEVAGARSISPFAGKGFVAADAISFVQAGGGALMADQPNTENARVDPKIKMVQGEMLCR